MKYERFEDLPVWQAAIELAKRVYDMTRDKFFSQAGDLRSQMRRASLSVSNNIAEGFERGSTAELLAFLYIARGSCGETRSMLLFTERFDEAAHLKSEISDLKALAESCSRQIRGWADNLQNSDIKGQRHLNDISRQQYEFQRSSDVFNRHIDEMVRRARPQDYPEEDDEQERI
ncbi:MAG: four helix bundle protein [Planctomycetota bacterium]